MIDIFKLLIGIFVGAISAWFAVINKLRIDTYKERRFAYAEIHRAATSMYLATIRKNKSDDELEKTFNSEKLILEECSFKYSFLVDWRVWNEAAYLSRISWEDAKSNTKNFCDIYDRLTKTMRSDLKLRQIEDFDSFLLTPIKHIRSKIQKYKRTKNKSGF